jgi:hypothetical protein
MLDRLEPGQRVCGKPGERPTVVVPESGLVVRPEGVRFENVDFLWEGPTDAFARRSEESSIIRLEAGRAEFRGCTFRARDGRQTAKTAIQWVHPVDRGQYEETLPSGQLRLDDCVFSDMGAAVACQTMGAVTVELAGVLHLARGPMVVLDHCPRLDEPVGLALSGLTLRGGGPVLECRCARVEDQPGRIAVQAVGCVLVPGAEVPLLRFVGPEPPGPLLAGLVWTGQGSIVGQETPIAAWQRPDGGTQTLDDASASIAGLVRSRVEFAGPADGGPGANRVVHWQVPLRSPQPPGIDPDALP